MSSITWTPTEVASSAAALHARAWRAVEAQHRVSTLRLVDTLAEQLELEQLLESSKPAVPEAARGLHWLLATPFRYPPQRQGSRFRAADEPGVFYAADAQRTACAELGYWRWRFLTDSPQLASLDALAQTLFQATIKTLGIDLRQAPFDRDAAHWGDPLRYEACQGLAGVARRAGVGAIRYASVRDPLLGGCIAVLTPLALRDADLAEQSWRLSVTRRRVFWHRESALNADVFEFDAAAWQAGPALG